MWFYLSFLLLIPSFTCETSKNETVSQNGVINGTNSSSQAEFRPSPQLETFYEYNKIPVPPVEPEAKTFTFGASPINWPDSVYTTAQPWTARIKFPATTTPRPYQFYNEDRSKSDSFFSKLPTFDEFNKQQLVQKNHFDFTAPVPQKSSPDLAPTHTQGNPWKKIVKFLTAVIPIGLLISALTPTVITVQSVNGTQSRSRAADAKGSSPHSELISSLNYFNSVGCDDRILCELVLSASATQNAEHHVENLLNTFTKEGKAVEKAEEMRRIFQAVKNQDCSAIACKSMDKT